MNTHTAPAPTVAQQEAAMLRLVADHLDVHRYLPPAAVAPAAYGWPARIQVLTSGDERGILAWGASLGVTEWRVDRHDPIADGPGIVYLHASGLGGELVGRAQWLDSTYHVTGVTIPSGELA